MKNAVLPILLQVYKHWLLKSFYKNYISDNTMMQIHPNYLQDMGNQTQA